MMTGLGGVRVTRGFLTSRVGDTTASLMPRGCLLYICAMLCYIAPACGLGDLKKKATRAGSCPMGRYFHRVRFEV